VFVSKFAGDEMAQKLGLFQGKARNIKRTIGPESDQGAGACQEGRPYFVMEYVAGIPITAYCDRHKLTVRRRMGVIHLGMRRRATRPPEGDHPSRREALEHSGV
jgi:hypothetical protein